MPPTKLADTREMTLDDAKAIFSDIARHDLEIEKRNAALEVRIAKLKAEHEAGLATTVMARDALAHRLTTYIMSHQDLFTRPRAVSTDFGRFGLRKLSNVAIASRKQLVDFALKHGHADLVKTTHTPQKGAIRRRLKAGEAIPGAELIEGQEAFYAVDKALVDEAQGR